MPRSTPIWSQTTRLAASWALVIALALSARPPGGHAQAPAASAPAAAAAPTARLPVQAAIEVQPGATCLERERLARRVARWLGRDHIDARLRIHGRGGASPTEVAFTVHRLQHEQPAMRTLTDVPEPCDQLHAAVGLSIALAVDAAVFGGATARPGPAPPAEPAEPPVEPEEQRAYGAEPGPRAAVALLAGFSAGMLLSETPVGALRVGLGIEPWFDVRLSALGTWGGGERFQDLEGTFDTRLLLGTLELCLAGNLGRLLRLTGCLGGGLGEFRTSGRGFLSPVDEGKLWAAASGGLFAEVALAPWLALAAGVDLLLPLMGRTIRVATLSGGTADERTVRAAAAVVSLGPVFRFF